MMLSGSQWAWPQHLDVRAVQALRNLELVVSTAEVTRAVDRMAVHMTARLQDLDPVLVTVLQGGTMLMGRLLARLSFPLCCGFVQATRYGAHVTPGELTFGACEVPPLTGRHVIFVDDILDGGNTLEALYGWARDAGAGGVGAAVLVRRLGRPQPIVPDFVGLELGTGFLVGCGMDLQGYGRNLPAVYRVPDAFLP